MKQIITLSILFATTFGFSQQFNPYVPQLPVNAMRDVGVYKQRLYQERSAWIQQQINRLVEVNNSLFNENKLPIDFNTSYHKNQLNIVLVDYVNNVKTYDFADDYYFNSIQDNFRKIEKYYYDYYNSIVEQYNSRKK